MIDTRKRGLMTLQRLITILLLPLWFYLVAAGCAAFGLTLLYEQINFPLYILGIVLASAVSADRELNLPGAGPQHFRWVKSIRKTNSEVLILALVLFGIVFATKDKAMTRMVLS